MPFDSVNVAKDSVNRFFYTSVYPNPPPAALRLISLFPMHFLYFFMHFLLLILSLAALPTPWKLRSLGINLSLRFTFSHVFLPLIIN